MLSDNKFGSLTQFYIKYYLLMNAVGNISTPVYIIADEESNAEFLKFKASLMESRLMTLHM